MLRFYQHLKDEMLLLEETEINNTFLNTTPQEMISYFLGQAGVTKSKLSPEIFPERRQVPIKKMSVIQAINAVHAAWGIKKKFFFSGGVFYWGEKPEQKKVTVFEYGVNVLTLTRSGGVWELETVSVPQFSQPLQDGKFPLLHATSIHRFSLPYLPESPVSLS